jgi:glycogen debranching enzyme
MWGVFVLMGSHKHHPPTPWPLDDDPAIHNDLTPHDVPQACSPRAWAAGALPQMLMAGLGIAPDGLRRTLRIRRPSLPRHPGRLAVHGLRVADASVDLLLERVAHATAAWR